MTKHKQKTLQKGFTLLELLIVVAIMGMMASMALAAFVSTRLGARDARRIIDLNSISKAFELYYTDNSRYPSGMYRTSDGDWSGLGAALNAYIRPFPMEYDTSDFFFYYGPNYTYSIVSFAGSDIWTECVRTRNGYYIGGKVFRNFNTASVDGGIRRDAYEIVGGGAVTRYSVGIVACPP